MIPADSHRLIGRPASLKYSVQNPANSILLCEEWSGLRLGPANQASGMRFARTVATVAAH